MLRLSGFMHARRAGLAGDSDVAESILAIGAAAVFGAVLPIVFTTLVRGGGDGTTTAGRNRLYRGQSVQFAGRDQRGHLDLAEVLDARRQRNAETAGLPQRLLHSAAGAERGRHQARFRGACPDDQPRAGCSAMGRVRPGTEPSHRPLGMAAVRTLSIASRPRSSSRTVQLRGWATPRGSGAPGRTSSRTVPSRARRG